MIPLHAPILTIKECLSYHNQDYVEKTNMILREYFNKENALFTADARNGLYLALKLMNLRKHDEVLMPAYICDVVFKTVCIICTPIIVDIKAGTFNIDPDQIEKKISKNTKGIIVAHLFGNPCEMNKIVEIAQRNKLQIIEDCAQSLGSIFDNKRIGTFGDFTILSFRFSKDISCFRGGALLTNQRIDVNLESNSILRIFPNIFLTLMALNTIRKIPSFIYTPLHDRLLVPIFSNNATKFKINTETLCNYQCYLIYTQITKLDSVIEQRRQNALYYSRNLKNIGKLPLETKGGYHTYYRYTIQFENRDKLLSHLMMRGIESDKMYDFTLAKVPNSEYAAASSINIPVHHRLSLKDKNMIIKAIHEFN